MASITWSVGDFFFYDNPRKPIYGVVTVVPSVENERGKCLLVVDTGLRTGRFNIASEAIPIGAVPTDLKGAGYSFKMALYAVAVDRGKFRKVRVV